MGEDTRTGGAAMSSDPEQLEREIKQTREQLGDTVEALADKADVKKQAKRKLDETKANVAEKADDLLGKAKEATPDDASTAAAAATEKARENPIPVAAVGAFAAGFLVGRLTKRVGS
jgi:ElaB/YqjD/DUF883 family membrane-anchored ribosome-binding protein